MRRNFVYSMRMFISLFICLLVFVYQYDASAQCTTPQQSAHTQTRIKAFSEDKSNVPFSRIENNGQKSSSLFLDIMEEIFVRDMKLQGGSSGGSGSSAKTPVEGRLRQEYDVDRYKKDKTSFTSQFHQRYVDNYRARTQFDSRFNGSMKKLRENDPDGYRALDVDQARANALEAEVKAELLKPERKQEYDRTLREALQKEFRRKPRPELEGGDALNEAEQKIELQNGDVMVSVFETPLGYRDVKVIRMKSGSSFLKVFSEQLRLLNKALRRYKGKLDPEYPTGQIENVKRFLDDFVEQIRQSETTEGSDYNAMLDKAIENINEIIRAVNNTGKLDVNTGEITVLDAPIAEFLSMYGIKVPEFFEMFQFSRFRVHDIDSYSGKITHLQFSIVKSDKGTLVEKIENYRINKSVKDGGQGIEVLEFERPENEYELGSTHFRTIREIPKNRQAEFENSLGVKVKYPDLIDGYVVSDTIHGDVVGIPKLIVNPTGDIVTVINEGFNFRKESFYGTSVSRHAKLIEQKINGQLSQKTNFNNNKIVKTIKGGAKYGPKDSPILEYRTQAGNDPVRIYHTVTKYSKAQFSGLIQRLIDNGVPASEIASIRGYLSKKTGEVSLVEIIGISVNKSSTDAFGQDNVISQWK